MTRYKATISKNKGKEALSIIFRHPVKIDPKTDYGVRVRRGLGTGDERIAQELVAQMNEILSDPLMWSIDKKQIAYGRFSKIIVEAFYDFLESESIDYEKIVDSVLKLPTKKEGYGKAILIGQSGAGKTSLLRCIMGTQKEKYPTTATGRTTTCTMEVILSESSEYELVVTFMSKELLTLYVKECVQNAVTFCVEKKDLASKKDVVEKLLTHKELTVRLSYILGHPSMIGQSVDDEFSDEDEFDEQDDVFYEDILDEDKCKEMINKIYENVEGVITIAKDFIDSDIVESNSEEEENEISLEFFLEKSELFNDIIDNIVDDIQERFTLLENGTVVSETRGWINVWHFKTTDRNEFMKQAKRFSSNNKSQWGSLLTPIVKFIRVKGNFKPDFVNKTPKAVLVDGLGLGHKTTSSAVPTEVTSRFQEMDSIILVDNAESPMMANAKVAIKTIVESGNTNKLLTCFTHMDEVTGDNLKSAQDKVTHVKSSVDSYLSTMKELNPPVITASDETDILESCFYMWNLDKDMKGSTQKQIQKLFDAIGDLTSNNTEKKDVELHYDILMLYPYLQEATKHFRKNWGKILGVPYKTPTTEHWTRIKALSRRLSYFNIDNYNNELMPVADLLRSITSQLNIFLSNPSNCLPENAPDSIRKEVIESIKRKVYARMHLFVKSAIWKEAAQSDKWYKACDYSKTGSVNKRAHEIDGIFQTGAPELNNYAPNMHQEQKNFVEGIVLIIKIVIEEEGGKLNAFSFNL